MLYSLGVLGGAGIAKTLWANAIQSVTSTTTVTLAVNGASALGALATDRITIPAVTVTQSTSITTTVAANGINGIITTVSSTLATTACAAFAVTNTAFGGGARVFLSISAYGGTSIPYAYVSIVGSNTFTINLCNVGPGTLNNVVPINFLILN